MSSDHSWGAPTIPAATSSGAYFRYKPTYSSAKNPSFHLKAMESKKCRILFKQTKAGCFLWDCF